jgi:hypothetical protein
LGLGYAFLDLDDMKENKPKFCDGLGDYDGSVGLFARTFVMPRLDFEKAILKFSWDVEQIARYYNIDYIQTYERGVDLNIWM